MKHFPKYFGIALLLLAVGFNVWLYRMEPTAPVDPNDNTFQYALVERTNAVWTYADGACAGITKPFCILANLSDHWVPNWAQGYNLPSYYSHVPQITIVATWRMVTLAFPDLPLFTYYHWVIYLLLSLLPVSVFAALRIIGMPWIGAGMGALVASHLSTDGLYGLDPTSFLWRGFGLSSQLFSAIWLPPALASAYRLFTRQRGMLPAVLFLAATTAGHLGIGIMAFLSIAVLAVSPFLLAILEQEWDKRTTAIAYTTARSLALLFGAVGLILGYWIIPIVLGGQYHNISVWDGIWKFDSFGYREVLKNLFNGDLFDFGRFPILTLLTGIGFYSAGRGKISADREQRDYFPFAVLYIFWLLLYFGRSTWGGLIDLIPGMSEFHISRFIVGVHMAGLFLIPIGTEWCIGQCVRFSQYRYSRHIVTFVTLVLLVASVYPQTIRYAAHNDFLIRRANENYVKDTADIGLLLSTLNKELSVNPGRVYAGRGGSWGKGFRIAETPMYMHLSTYGIPVILWLPETWSPNSDTEQYFSENNPDHYVLYNVRYVVTPSTLPRDQIQPFWKHLTAGKTWNIYTVDTDGYVTGGVRPAIVSSTKTDYRSLIRLWMHSDTVGTGLYPELTFDTGYPKPSGLPNFRMADEASYIIPDGSRHSLFAEPPVYMAPSPAGSQPAVIDQTQTADVEFRATVDVGNDCTECIVVLRQSFHPSWRATIDGKPVQPFAVFPFYIGVKLDTPGSHTVVFTYKPSYLKQFLLLIGLLTIGGLLWKALIRYSTVKRR